MTLTLSSISALSHPGPVTSCRGSEAYGLHDPKGGCRGNMPLVGLAMLDLSRTKGLTKDPLAFKLSPPPPPYPKYMYLLRVLMGSLCSLRLLWLVRVIILVLTLRHSLQNCFIYFHHVTGEQVWLRGESTRLLLMWLAGLEACEGSYGNCCYSTHPAHAWM